jgi:glycosyltransferase involved in cell wall biosynthesis
VLERRRELRLEQRFHFHGRTTRREVAEHLARASACLATARYESWGIALAEALRAGVPVVGETVAGVLEFTGGRGWRSDARAWLPRLLDDSCDGRALREEAAAVGAALPTWADCASTTARELEALCARG